MRAWWKLILRSLVIAAAVALGVAILLGWQPLAVVAFLQRQTLAPIRIGLLHSQTGLLSLSEKSLLDAEILAIEEINAQGGIKNRQIVWRSPDCKSDAKSFAAEARRLLETEQVTTLFGCWTSESRKAVLPVLDEFSSLLFFPGNFEGIERSPRVIYAGGIANQSILPAVRWAYDSLKARKFFVVGLEEVWSRCSSEIGKDGVKAAGGEMVGERYTVPMTPAVDAIVEAIRQAKPDVVLNFMYGDANLAFYATMRRAGMPPDKLPVIAFGFAEDEARRFPQADVVGQYAAWNYFQSVERPENRDFVRRFRARWGENRVVGDPMVAAYNSIKFWAQAASEVDPTNSAAMTANLARQSMDAPDGIVTVDGETQAFWRPFHLGRLLGNGQFEIVWSIEKPIRPVLFVGTRTSDQWRSFLEYLKTRWNGRWSAGSSQVSDAVAPAR